MQKNVTLNFQFPKCQTHAYTRFENGCSENSTQKLLTKYSRSVRIGKNCALGLEYGPRSAASGLPQDLSHSFSQYGPPGRQITYIYTFRTREKDKKYSFINWHSSWIILIISRMKSTNANSASDVVRDISNARPVASIK